MWICSEQEAAVLCSTCGFVAYLVFSLTSRALYKLVLSRICRGAARMCAQPCADATRLTLEAT